MKMYAAGSSSFNPDMASAPMPEPTGPSPKIEEVD
jgi:hypothetical protein